MKLELTIQGVVHSRLITGREVDVVEAGHSFSYCLESDERRFQTEASDLCHDPWALNLCGILMHTNMFIICVE